MEISKRIRMEYLFKKILLWDFIQIMRKRDDLNLVEKVTTYFKEYVHKVIKIVIRNYTLYKGRHFETFIE